MKIKTGPLVVVGLLALLVGLTLVLSPAPPPASEHHDHDHEQETKPPAKEPPKPEVTLAQIQAVLDSGRGSVSEALDKLGEIVATGRDQQRTEALAYVAKLSTDKREAIRTGAVGIMVSAPEIKQETILRILKTDSSPAVKRIALQALAKYPLGSPAEQALVQFEKDPDPDLRSSALIAHTQMLSGAGKAGNERLVKLLGQFDNDASAKAAISFHAQEARALPILIKTLYESKKGPQREAAAMVIGLICAGYNPKIDAFAKQAQVTHRQEMGHRQSNPTGVAPLIWALQNDPYAPTREIAAQGLGYLGDVRAAKPLGAALRDPDALVRRRAAAALITVPAESVIPELSAAATTDKVPEVRRFAVEALGWIGSSAVVPALNQAMADQSPLVRRYAAIELGRIADPGSLEALSAALDTTPDPDPDVRWAAVVALGKLQDKRAEHVLVQALGDPSPQVSNSAERALQRLGIARHESEGFEG